jgi:hypothetical protein
VFCRPGSLWFTALRIVIKPGPGVDPAKGPGPGFQGSTRINPEKLKKKKSFNISYEKIHVNIDYTNYEI